MSKPVLKLKMPNAVGRKQKINMKIEWTVGSPDLDPNYEPNPESGVLVHKSIEKMMRDEKKGKSRKLSKEEIEELTNEELPNNEEYQTLQKEIKELEERNKKPLSDKYKDEEVDDPWIYKPYNTKTLISHTKGKVPILSDLQPIAPRVIISCDANINKEKEKNEKEEEQKEFDKIPTREILEDLEEYNQELKNGNYEYFSSYTKFYRQLLRRGCNTKLPLPCRWQKIITEKEKEKFKDMDDMNEEEFGKKLLKSLRKKYNSDDEYDSD